MAMMISSQYQQPDEKQDDANNTTTLSTCLSSSTLGKYDNTTTTTPIQYNHHAKFLQKLKNWWTKSKIEEPKPIQHTDAPQWEWTNHQCITWITECLVHYSHRPREIACQEAEIFMNYGFGPRLFAMPPEEWFRFFGPPGKGIYFLISSRCYKKGALPKDHRFKHFTTMYTKSL